jgi:uncharacterized protein (DUF885 family)
LSHRRCLVGLLAAFLPLTGFAQPAGEQLHALLAEEWENRLQANPLLGSRTGDPRYASGLPEVGVAAESRRADAARSFLSRLEGIDREALGRQDRISYEMFAREMRDRIADFEHGDHFFPFNSDSGFHIAFARLASGSFLSTGDYDGYVGRLRAAPRYFEQHVALLRDGLARGFSQPRVVLEGYDGSISAHVVEVPADSVFYEPFTRFPPAVSQADRERLLEEGEAAIREGVIPAYRAFLTFFRDEYLEQARGSIGASELPGGREYYAHLVKRFTTLDVTPEQVHAIGLEEVARIREEMEAVILKTGFEGSFAEFLEFLRSDPRFYAKTPEELLRAAAWICKRMDARLPSLFRTLPRQPYGVEAVPDAIAPKYTGGRYVGAPLGGTRAGTYWVNTYKLESRPLYVLESLSLHEAVPGHHLQNALRQELEDLPAFRRHGGVGAYGEGWGLYSERLGLEAGFYTDPYSDFGRLTYEMWRACRLVVDTGIHAMGWTRERAVELLASNTALSRHEVGTETDRYIGWPGQALSYKMGEIEIRGLRRRAERELGERFDVRAFHDVVLLNGPVPLTVLRELVDEHIRERLADQQS